MSLWAAQLGRLGVLLLSPLLVIWPMLAGQVFLLAPWSLMFWGSFILGALVEFSALAWSPSPEIRAMLVVGMLGAFTTFSTFSLDVVTLSTRGAWMQVALYLGLSVALSVLALYMGMQTLRTLLN